MKRKVMLFTLAVTLASCKTVEPVVAPETTPTPSTPTLDWVAQSNDIAEQYTRSFSTLYPELGSSLGYQEYDKQGTNLTPESSDKGIALQKVWQKKLKKLLQHTTDKNLKVDLLILLGKVEDDLELEAVHAQMGVLNFRQASKSVYNSLLGLINEQSPAKRKLDGVSRFKFIPK
jgi:hypothetical protein